MKNDFSIFRLYFNNLISITMNNFKLVIINSYDIYLILILLITFRCGHVYILSQFLDYPLKHSNYFGHVFGIS